VFQEYQARTGAKIQVARQESVGVIDYRRLMAKLHRGIPHCFESATVALALVAGPIQQLLDGIVEIVVNGQRRLADDR
jgi:hypothetical protein